jgi:hypothetical protein
MVQTSTARYKEVHIKEDEMSSYPDSDDLLRIGNWEIKSYAECHRLMDFVFSIWAYPEMCWRLPDGQYKLATGGWSGNEEIISAMESNLIFWGMFWQSSNRGGGHVFGETI